MVWPTLAVFLTTLLFQAAAQPRNALSFPLRKSWRGTRPASANFRITYIEVRGRLSEWTISTVSRAAIERTINSFATDFEAVLSGSKLISSDSEGWPDADRQRRHKLQNGRMLAGTKTILLAKPVKTQGRSTKRSAHSHVQSFFSRQIMGAGYLVTLSCPVACFDQNATQRLQGESIARRSLWGMMIK